MADESRIDPEERRSRTRLRWVAFAVIAFLLILAGVADILGRLLLNPEFHVSDIFFGSLIGALLALVGIEGLARISVGNR